MDRVNITSAMYFSDDELTGKNSSITAVIDGVTLSVPLDPANRHYAEIVKQIEAGTLVVQPADEN